jgi:CO/xanthine dehydrogenase Mo-binding subunit
VLGTVLLAALTTFGCKGWCWSYELLAAMAARLCARTVKLVLTREQMFTSCGHRSETEQRLRIGASPDGTLRSILHDVTATSSQVVGVGTSSRAMRCVTTTFGHANKNVETRPADSRNVQRSR